MSDQIQDRIAKLERIRALGVEPYGTRFTGITRNAELRDIGDKLNIPAGQTAEGDGACFRAAGRVALFRDTGKLIFMTVRDWSGDIQWAISKKAVEDGTGNREQAADGAGRGAQGAGSVGVSPARVAPSSGGTGVSPVPGSTLGESPFPDGPIAWQLAKLLDLGDIVGAFGRLGRTKTGELTLWVSHIRLLSKAVRPPPEKWHGLTDVEARYRKRYVDLLSNPESQRQFVVRAKIIDYAREVLRRRGFIEVETPVLQPIYGGAAARPFVTHHNTLDMKLYLRISPELYLKRCLVGGLERVYEFARCFRNEGISPRHNPEFTMLELYQAYGDYHDMMDITEAIIAGAARDVIGSYVVGKREQGTGNREQTGSVGVSPAREDAIDFTPPWPRRRYGDLFAEHVGFAMTDAAACRAKARELFARKQISVDESKADDAVVIGALFEHFVEDKLVNPTFVLDYPAPLCPLTKRAPKDRPDAPDLALRFECFVNGMEMGNAYSELNDPKVQHDTFSAQLRGEGDETMAVMDEDYVEALEYGLPPAGGLGIGIDRLCMLLTGSESIREVLLFPLQRAQT
ncbi:Lysine--tRNA ligase [Phycisphaerae bacterium RAS1]|nr:Lysine--tRNA ligase [Phycisphaerae bacterium RAS1]